MKFIQKQSTKIISLLLLCVIMLNAQQSDYQYVNPVPNSVLNSIQSPVIIREGSFIDKATLSANVITVKGSKSGNINGKFILADDDKTILFKTTENFAYNETVMVKIGSGLRSQSGEEIKEFSYKFFTVEGESPKIENTLNSFILNNSGAKPSQTYSTLPQPPIVINSVNNPSPGTIFMATWDRNIPAKYANFLFILDNRGNIIDSIRVNGAPYDLRIQPNGYLSYALGDFSGNVPGAGEKLRYIILDDNLTIVDSFETKNGYPTDFHELLYLPNGHALMMSYFSTTYDMSKIVEGGKTNANLVINIIQEQDKDKNVVFEWRNIDYIPITDSDLNLTLSRVNYSTLNGFEIDFDGNILASFRNHSAIMKISRTTGEILWKCGGPNSDFTFIGEHEENAPYYFSRQHDVRRLPNGNITLFDNGEFHSPSYSRAVEYSLDEVNKTITLVSEYRYSDGNIFAAAAGNALKLDNEGWFVGYGILHPQSEVKRNVVEVSSDGSIELEISLPNNVISYRTSKQNWKEQISSPSVSIFEAVEENTYSFNNESDTTGVEIKYIQLNGESYNTTTITKLPYGPIKPEFTEEGLNIYPVKVIYEGAAVYSQSAEIHISLNQFPEIKAPENTTVYWRNFPNQGLFIPKNTVFNSELNELVFNLSGFGEIVFGNSLIETKTNVPILYKPENKQRVILENPFSLFWTGKGFYSSFNVQVATDSNFSTLVFESNTNNSSISVGDLSNNTKYFWRVNSQIDNETSDWSEVFSFIITDPFIELLYPNGAELLSSGTTSIIRWESNILDSIQIEFFEGENQIENLGAAPGIQRAFEWKIPDNITVGNNYKIKITDHSNTDLFDFSDAFFEITDTIAAVENTILPSEFKLLQNYPNPFNPATKIQYNIPLAALSSVEVQHVTLKIYDLLGKEVAALVNENQKSGIYEVVWMAKNQPSGIYYYQLKAGSFTKTRKMILLK